MRILFLFVISTLVISCSDKKKLNLENSVEVLRDNFGINHIYAKNQKDLFYMQGYLAAKDRLFQFEVWRRQATGTVSEILGKKELDRDIEEKPKPKQQGFFDKWVENLKDFLDNAE